MQQLTKNVYVETGTRGCNHGFVTTSQGVVMIDTPQVPSHALKLREEVAKHCPVAYVFNTEPHPDHWTGNSFFEAPCIAHYGVRERILSSGIAPVMERVQTMGPAEVRVPGHGDVCGKGYLDEQREFIQEWVGLVRRAMEQGMTKSDAMDKLSLLDRYPMDVEIDFMGPAVMRWNVSRLYDVIATE